MKGTYSALMQSKFFNPAFNSAIFDGPIRVYFSQAHESAALKIYFQIQKQLVSELSRAKELHQFLERNVLLMLYPTRESFQHSFDSVESAVRVDDLLGDTVIGVAGPVQDEDLDQILGAIRTAFESWEKIPFERPDEDAIL